MTSSAAVFAVGGVVYTWTDVADIARSRGDWEAVTEAAANRNPAPSQEDADAAARAFRHARRLLSADDLGTWLDRRGVTVERWLDYVRGTAGTDEDDVWAEAMCSGLLDERARELARQLAVAASGGGAATQEAVDREIAAARLDWIRVRCTLAVFAEESVAAEVALCVREDGLPFADVAAGAGVPAAEHELWLEDADPPLAPLLAAARPGELVGPVRTATGLAVAELHEKLPADPADPAVRARGERAAVERATDRAETDHVVWYEQL